MRRKWMACFLVLTMLTGMFPTAFAMEETGQGEPDAPICTNEAGCSAAVHDPACPEFETPDPDIDSGSDVAPAPEAPENPVCTRDEACTAEMHDPACPHYPMQEEPETPEESDEVSCTQGDACQADTHEPACPRYPAQEDPAVSRPELDEPEEKTPLTTVLSETGYDQTITVENGKLQEALDSIPDNAGDVRLLVNQDIQPTLYTEYSVPVDKGITSLTLCTEQVDGVTIGSTNSTYYFFANGVPLIVDTGVQLSRFSANIFGGGKTDIEGGTSITVNEGAEVGGILYGGGMDSDVSGDVSILVNGSVGTLYGGGYAFGSNQKGSSTAHANVDGDISIQVTGEQSALSRSLYGGGYAYSGVNKEKDDVQSMQANVTGSISIYLDSPNLPKSLELYGGGHAEMVTTDITLPKASNITLEANVAGNIEIVLSGDARGTEGYDNSNSRKIWGGGYARSYINGNKEVDIENISLTANVNGDISVDASKNNHAISTANKWDNSMLWSLYGGGLSSGQFTNAIVDGDTQVKSCRKTLNSPGGTFGGGCAYQGGVARVTGDTHVEIVRASSQPDGHENAKGVIGGGEGGFYGDATVEGSTYIKINDNIAFESDGTGIVGGGYASEEYGTASVLGNITVDVGDGYSSPSQFVGGGYTSKANSTATVGDPHKASSQISINFYGAINTRASMYGAGHTIGSQSNASVYGDVNATFDGADYKGAPTLWAYIGGYAENNTSLSISGDVSIHITNHSNLPSCVIRPAGNNTTIDGNTSVLVDQESYCDTVYGGGSNVRVQNAAIRIQNASVQNMYGGGSGASSYVGNVAIAVDQSKITGRLCGGGYKGPVQNVNMQVSNSTLQDVYGGGYEGSVQNVDMQVSNSTLQDVYGGGGNTSTSENVTSTSENVKIAIDDSTITGWIYMAGKNATVTGNSYLALLGNTQICGVTMETNDVVIGDTQVTIGDGTKPSDVKVQNYFYRNSISSLSILENAALTGLDATGNELFFNLKHLNIAKNGKLVLAKMQDFGFSLNGEGTISLPAGANAGGKLGLVLWNDFTGHITLETPSPAAGSLAWSQITSTGTFAYGGNDYVLVRSTDDPWYRWDLVTGYPVTASVTPLEDGTAGGTVDPASQAVAAGGDAEITITRNPGYKVSQVLVNGVDQTDSLQGNKLTLHNVTDSTTVVISFEKMTAADIHDSAQDLPEIQPDKPLDEAEKETVLDTKLDYEALPDEEKAQVSEESRNKLNEALAALPEVKVELELEIEGDNDIVKAEEDLPSLLENMTDEEARAIQEKAIAQYKLVVKVAEAEPTSDIQASIDSARAEYTATDHFDVIVQKIVTKPSMEPKRTSLSTLARPITLTFVIPDELLDIPGNTTRTFSMLRTHQEGADYTTTALEDLDGDLETYTIRSDRFSVYTLAYKDTKKSSGSGSSHSSGSSKPSYSISVDDPAHGSITADRRNATKGTIVTITVKSDDGYMLDDLVVTGKSGKTVKLAEKKEDQYTFTMPDESVTLTAEFVREKAELESLPFSDVSDNAWYADAVRYVYAHGLMRGANDNAFAPDASTTRGMIVTILYRMEDAPSRLEHSAFEDVPADQYYADAVAWAAANGIVSGYNDRTFGPDDPITREQMAAILYRYANWKGYDVSARADLSVFTDVGAVSSYAVEALQWANAAELVSGTSMTTLTPGAHANRAQVAAILTRFCQRFLDEIS